MTAATATRSTTYYVEAVAVLAVAVAAFTLVQYGVPTQDEIVAAAFFALVGGLAHSMAYRLPRGGFGSISFIPLLSSVAVVPGFATVAGTCVAILSVEAIRRRETIRGVFNTAQFTLASGVAVVVYGAAGGEPMSIEGVRNVIPFVAGFSAFFLVNAFAFAGVVAVSTHQKPVSVLVRAISGAVIYDICAIPFVYGFATAYVRLGAGWTGALLLPLFGLRHVYKTNWELQAVNEELLQLMVAAIEARDPYTSGHSQRVAEYSRIVSYAAGLTPKQVERVFTAALLHDVGKIHEEFAPILRKQGRLTDEEFEVMKSHAEKGAALVSRVSQFADLIAPIRGHHEAWDGSGYPDHLAGEAVPLWARIIALADTIDAMTTDRPYREALTPESVRDEISREAGRQFDPRLAKAVTSDPVWAKMAAALTRNNSDLRSGDVIAQVPLRHSAGIGLRQ